MRSAVSRFIECISIAQISLTEKIKRSLLDTLNENLKHPNSNIQVFLFTQLYLQPNFVCLSLELFCIHAFRMLLLKPSNTTFPLTLY